VDVDRRRLGGEREQLVPRPGDRFIDRARDLQRLRIERPVRGRSGRQDGEVFDDVLARRDARTADLGAVASETS
jgi:hypothetical protein